jgi:hypothetical protein
VKQSVRAVRASATPVGGTGAPGGLVNPLSLHERCFNLVERPRLPAVSNTCQTVPHRIPAPRNDETPEGSADRGLKGENLPGLPAGQPRNSKQGLTHHNFQRTQRRATGNHGIPGADAGRRARCRGKNS